MDRVIPGINEVEGREFIYVEASDAENFSSVLENALAASPDVPLPTSGGAIEEKARILLEDNTSLLAISYKGDVRGWRKKFASFCEATGKKWGITKNGTLSLSNGVEIPLEDCEVNFES